MCEKGDGLGKKRDYNGRLQEKGKPRDEVTLKTSLRRKRSDHRSFSQKKKI